MVTHYPPGQTPASCRPGDFTLHRATTDKTRSGPTTLLGRLIQAGERARFGNTDYARWTHSTLLATKDGGIIEATAKGVTVANLEKYRDTDFMVVSPRASAEQRLLAVAFARRQVGQSYGVLNFIALGFQALFGWSISLHDDREFICSGLVARATEKYVVEYPRSPESMMPADLARYWGAVSKEPIPDLGWFGRLLNLIVGLTRGA